MIEQLFCGRIVYEQRVQGVLPVARHDHQLGQRRVGYGVDERQEVQPGVQHLGVRGIGRRLEETREGERSDSSGGLAQAHEETHATTAESPTEHPG